MKISELIKRLESMKSDHGDIEVHYSNRHGYCTTVDRTDYDDQWDVIFIAQQ